MSDLAHARAGVLAEVDRRAEAERDRHEQGDAGDEEGAADQRQDAEALRLDDRRPVRAEEELADGRRRSKKTIVSRSSEMTMPVVVSTESSAARSRSALDDVLARRDDAPPPERGWRVSCCGCLLPCLQASGYAWPPPPERCLGLGRLLVGQRHDLRGLRDRRLVLEHVVHERLHLGPSASDFSLGYMNSGRDERLVAAVLDRLVARLDAAVAAVDADQVQLVLVLLVVGEAEVAEAALVALDALDEHVVVLGRLVLLARDALLTVDLVGEEVERAGVGAGPEER